MLRDQLNGERRYFLPYWMTSVLVTEFLCCVVIVASIFIRRIHNVYALENLPIGEEDESVENLKSVQDILKPL